MRTGDTQIELWTMTYGGKEGNAMGRKSAGVMIYSSEKRDELRGQKLWTCQGIREGFYQKNSNWWRFPLKDVGKETKSERLIEKEKPGN